MTQFPSANSTSIPIIVLRAYSARITNTINRTADFERLSILLPPVSWFKRKRKKITNYSVRRYHFVEEFKHKILKQEKVASLIIYRTFVITDRKIFLKFYSAPTFLVLNSMSIPNNILHSMHAGMYSTNLYSRTTNSEG